MVEFEDRGVISVLRMIRGKGNSLNLDLTAAVLDALDRLESSPARAGVLTGQGNTFCAGVDLAALVEGGPDYVRRFLPLFARLLERLMSFPKPLVAAVNGHAIAGGAMLVLTADQRLLARGTARMGLTELKVGVVFSARALEIARFATPPQHLSTLILSARTWAPEEAFARGLVDELVGPEQLLDRACEVAGEMAAVQPAAFTATKLALRRPMIEAARERGAKSDSAVLEHWSSTDTLRQVASFVEQVIKRRG
jgi:enoyl-CoA hydratase